MKRTIANPVFMDLNEKQIEYLKSFKYVEVNSDSPAYVEIYKSFTMDELNEIFDELEKLED